MHQETRQEHLSSPEDGRLRKRSEFEKHQEVTDKPCAKWEVSKEGIAEDSSALRLGHMGKWQALTESRQPVEKLGGE